MTGNFLIETTCGSDRPVATGYKCVLLTFFAAFTSALFKADVPKCFLFLVVF